MTLVLVVEDDLVTRDMLSELLPRLGYDVLVAPTGGMGLAMAADKRPDVVLLDLGLPDVSGIEVIARLRAWTDTHILVVSGSRQVRRKADALDAGADDFIDKPFDVSELRARLRVAERRRDLALQRQTRRRFGALVVDYTHRRLHRGEEEIRLTDTEWSVLEGLSREPGRVVTHRWLTTHVWGARTGADAHVTIRAHVKSLRAKLGDDARDPVYVRTETGLGYRWVAVPNADPPEVSPWHELLSRLESVRSDLAGHPRTGLTSQSATSLARADRLLDEVAQVMCIVASDHDERVGQ